MTEKFPPLAPLPIKHDWHQWRDMTCCRQCGFIRNEKNAEALCRGRVKVALREGSAA